MILVTGANGRLGAELVRQLHGAGQAVRAGAREMPRSLPTGVEGFAVGAVDGATDWGEALAGVTAVAHCAGITTAVDERDFVRVNVEGSAALARQAAAAGAQRLVFISSMTVNGRHSGDRPFRHDDPPRPETAYSRSKADAEATLREIATETGIEIVAVRPPRIVWPELSGNLRQLAALVRRGVPLPFGAIRDNARDNVSAHNLIDIITRALAHPQAANRVLLAGDGDPLSTRALIERLGRYVGRSPRLVSVPRPALRALAHMAPARLRGQLSAGELADELTENLRIDIEHTRAVLDWTPKPPVLA